MSKRPIAIVFVLFAVVAAAVFHFQHRNAGQVRRQFEAVVQAEGKAINELMQQSGRLLAETDPAALKAFLERIARIPAVLYAGMYREKTLVQLFTRYEGYFPVSTKKRDLSLLPSPLGQILNIRSRFRDHEDQEWTIHLGFNSDYLDLLARNTQRGFLVQALILIVAFGTVILLLFFFNRAFFQKEMELQRERQAREGLEELSLFSAEIAHEIRNPLNSLHLTFDALTQQNKLDEERSQRYLDAVREEIRRITAILDAYTRQSRPITPRIEAVDLELFFSRLQTLLEGEFRRHNAELVLSLPPQNTFPTDSDLLRQILQNLIRNSLEAHAKRIVIDARLHNKGLEVKITDDGEGIPPSRKEQVFKPYMSSKAKGTGLGLHVVRRLVIALGGDIHLEMSRKGMTRFRFVLPPGEPHAP